MARWYIEAITPALGQRWYMTKRGFKDLWVRNEDVAARFLTRDQAGRFLKALGHSGAGVKIVEIGYDRDS